LGANGENFTTEWGNVAPRLFLSAPPPENEERTFRNGIVFESALGNQLSISVVDEAPSPTWQVAYRIDTLGLLDPVWHRIRLLSVPSGLARTVFRQRRDGTPSFWLHPNKAVTPVWVGWCRDWTGAELRLSGPTTAQISSSVFSLFSDGQRCSQTPSPDVVPSRMSRRVDFECPSTTMDEVVFKMESDGITDNAVRPVGFRGERSLTATMRPATIDSDPAGETSFGPCWTWWFAP